MNPTTHKVASENFLLCDNGNSTTTYLLALLRTLIISREVVHRSKCYSFDLLFPPLSLLTYFLPSLSSYKIHKILEGIPSPYLTAHQVSLSCPAGKFNWYSWDGCSLSTSGRKKSGAQTKCTQPLESEAQKERLQTTSGLPTQDTG